jgi:hypothetical protein
MARLKHVVKLAETLLSIGAHLVVLEGFCCSRQGDVRPIGGEVNGVRTPSSPPLSRLAGGQAAMEASQYAAQTMPTIDHQCSTFGFSGMTGIMVLVSDIFHARNVTLCCRMSSLSSSQRLNNSKIAILSPFQLQRRFPVPIE